jgi:hypothetical protein
MSTWIEKLQEFDVIDDTHNPQSQGGSNVLIRLNQEDLEITRGKSFLVGRLHDAVVTYNMTYRKDATATPLKPLLDCVG